MKAVILAGGLGTRLSEETAIRPKPMVEVGGKPILWHVMKIYAKHGITDFVVLGGYKVEYIRQFFLHYCQANSDFTIDLSTGEILWKRAAAEPWRVTVLDTGADSMTGGRVRRAKDVIGTETFCLTYGDGVSDVNIQDLIAFHRRKQKLCTVTAVTPPGRFGVLGLSPDGEEVKAFREKDAQDVGLINGGFFVCEPAVMDLIAHDGISFEREPMEALVAQGELASFRHLGFWQAMDTLRDKQVLEEAHAKGAPWL